MVGQYTCTHTTHTLLFIVLQIESFVVLWIVCGALQMGLLLTRDLREACVDSVQSTTHSKEACVSSHTQCHCLVLVLGIEDGLWFCTCVQLTACVLHLETRLLVCTHTHCTQIYTNIHQYTYTLAHIHTRLEVLGIVTWTLCVLVHSNTWIWDCVVRYLREACKKPKWKETPTCIQGA